MINYRIHTALSLVLLMSLSTSNVQDTGKPQKFDGHWWVENDNNTRDEYFQGYQNCYRKGLRRPLPWGNIGNLAYLQNAVAFYYHDHPDSPGVPIRELVKKFGKESNRPETRTQKELEQGETGEDDLSYFSRDYWEVRSARQHLAFVAGETECFNDAVRSPKRFSKSYQEYVKAIDQQYASHPKEQRSFTLLLFDMADRKRTFRKH